MSESVIFNSPLLLVLYGVALALMLIDLKIKSTGYVLPVISAIIVAGASTYALLSGADLVETAAVIAVFLVINLLELGRKRK